MALPLRDGAGRDLMRGDRVFVSDEHVFGILTQIDCWGEDAILHIEKGWASTLIKRSAGMHCLEVFRSIKNYRDFKVGDGVDCEDIGYEFTGKILEIFSNGLARIKTGYLSSHAVLLSACKILNAS